MEHVHHHIHEIEQRPSSGAHAFDVMRASPVFLDGLEHALGEGPDMGVGRARRNDEEVRRITDVAQIEHDDVLPLVVLEGMDGEPELAERSAGYGVSVGLGANGSPLSSGVGSSIW